MTRSSITKTLLGLLLSAAVGSTVRSQCLKPVGSGSLACTAPTTCAAATGCATTLCNVAGGGTLSVSIAGPTTCTSQSPTNCPTSTACTTGDSFITNGATITASAGVTGNHTYAICEYIITCGTGTTATSQCTVTTINGGGTFTTSGMSQAGSGSYQHVAVAYETTGTVGCNNCPGACATFQFPLPGPTCAACTPSIAASCCVVIP